MRRFDASIHPVEDYGADVIQHVAGIKFALYQSLDVSERKSGSGGGLLQEVEFPRHEQHIFIEYHDVPLLQCWVGSPLSMESGGERVGGSRTPSGGASNCPSSRFGMRSKLESVGERFSDEESEGESAGN
jgi:hypothetical protein